MKNGVKRRRDRFAVKVPVPLQGSGGGRAHRAVPRCSPHQAPGESRGLFSSRGAGTDPGKGCTSACTPQSCCCARRWTSPISGPPRTQTNLTGRGLPSLTLDIETGATKRPGIQRSSAWSCRTSPTPAPSHLRQRGSQRSSSFPQPDRSHGLMKINQVLFKALIHFLPHPR